MYCQVEDLKAKYDHLEQLQQNGWVVVEDEVDQVAKVGKSNIKSKCSPIGHHSNNIHKSNPIRNGQIRSTSAVDQSRSSTSIHHTKPVRSNIREFLKNKRQELVNHNDGVEQAPPPSPNGHCANAVNGNDQPAVDQLPTVINLTNSLTVN